MTQSAIEITLEELQREEAELLPSRELPKLCVVHIGPIKVLC